VCGSTLGLYYEAKKDNVYMSIWDFVAQEGDEALSEHEGAGAH